MKLDRIKEIDLRSRWKNEEEDFTPWLADNPDHLSDALDIELEVIGKEVPVGGYTADLLARPIGQEETIIVENQLGRSDHEHLGKIITYSAGLDADFIVWICGKIREEHRSAIDWLNRNSEGVGYLGLEIKLLQIGDSKPAPVFDVVCSPDDWSDYVKSIARKELSDTERLQRELWTKFREYMEEEGTVLSLRKPWARGWYSFSVGKSGFKISLTAMPTLNRVGCELYVSKSGEKAIDILETDKEAIEEKCGTKLEWQRLPGKEASRIVQYKDWDIEDKENWSKLFPWFKERAETFHEVFSPRVKEIEV